MLRKPRIGLGCREYTGTFVDAAAPASAAAEAFVMANASKWTMNRKMHLITRELLLLLQLVAEAARDAAILAGNTYRL